MVTANSRLHKNVSADEKGKDVSYIPLSHDGLKANRPRQTLAKSSLRPYMALVGCFGELRMPRELLSGADL